MNVFFFLLLTIYSHQDRRLSFRLVAGHGGVDICLDVVTVPPHPLSVPDQDGVRRRLSWKKRNIVKIAAFSHDFRCVWSVSSCQGLWRKIPKS